MMTKLSDTQRVILSKAAQHEALLAAPPAKLPAAARNAVLRSLLAKTMLHEIAAPREFVGLGWRQDEDGTWIALRITAAGLAAMGLEASMDLEASPSPQPVDKEEVPSETRMPGPDAPSSTDLPTVCQSARKRDPQSACKRGSDSLSVQIG
jgi:hypothetical protein